MTSENKGAGGHSGQGVWPSLEAADARALALLETRIPGLIALYRFGSAANGTLRPDSDLDYAILAAAPLDPVCRFEIQEESELVGNRLVVGEEMTERGRARSIGMDGV